jgi:hypothetical protein
LSRLIVRGEYKLPDSSRQLSLGIITPRDVRPLTPVTKALDVTREVDLQIRDTGVDLNVTKNAGLGRD